MSSIRISDLQTWLGAFSRFEETRRRAGVRAERVLQPIDDDKYIYLDLDFDGVEQAAAFQQFLETNVWTSRDASPALAGTPRARVLTKVDTGHLCQALEFEATPGRAAVAETRPAVLVGAGAGGHAPRLSGDPAFLSDPRLEALALCLRGPTLAAVRLTSSMRPRRSRRR